MPTKRPEAARCTACPTRTEPVKTTAFASAAPASRSASASTKCRHWNTPAGSPAAAKAPAKRSAESGVKGECLRSTALPARIAGTTEFTAVSSG